MCSDVHVEIRRESDNCGITGNASYSDLVPQGCSSVHRNNDHDYGAFVSFCCEDLQEDGDGDGVADGMIKVWMRVWDDGNMDGIFGSFRFENGKCELLDNYNETWVYVTVENKAPGLIICPPDIEIPCDWDYTDLSVTGTASGSTTCGEVEVTYDDWGDLHCGEGVITREWYVVGNEDYKCSQRIVVYNQTGAQGLSVQCPSPNEVVVDCDDYVIPEPWYGTGACNLAGISSTIDTFYFEQDACYKVLKKWTIIDWCSGEEMTCSFTLAMIDTDAPEIMCQDTCFAVDDYWDADNDGNYCELANDIIVTNAGATDTGNCPSEWIKWVIQVDYWNDGTIDAERSSFVPHSSSTYIAPTQMGEEVSMRLRKNLASAEWAIHKVKYKAFDGCGNVTQCEQLVEVADKKAPTPYCIGISTALMDENAGNLVELWASDFDLGSFDNCTESEHLLFTFNRVSPLLDRLDQVHYFDANGPRPASAYEGGYPVQKWNPATNSSATKFVGVEWCGSNQIEISVWDEKYNTDYCLVELIIEGIACGNVSPRVDVAGYVMTEGGDMVQDVTLTNNSEQLGYPKDISTTSDGAFAFGDNLMHTAYTISAHKDNGHLNGISTLDLVLIQRHILSLRILESGYKLIAADINSDERVTAADLVELRKLILGIYSQLPENDSWRFVNADIIPSTTSPWPFVETREINNLDTDMMEENFVGVKIGDVNGSVIANTNLQNIEVDNRSNTSLEMIIEQVGNEVVFKAGDRYNDIYGYQFTLRGAKGMHGVNAGALDMADHNVAMLPNGALTVSYANESGQTVDAGTILFSLTVDGSLNIQKDGYVKAEAYQGSDLEIIDIDLRDGNATTQMASLSQNEPNPFSDQTNITFSIPTENVVTFTVYDVTGKVVYTESSRYNAGVHVKNFDKTALGKVTGVLYAEMKTTDFTESIKMIKVR